MTLDHPGQLLFVTSTFYRCNPKILHRLNTVRPMGLAILPTNNKYLNRHCDYQYGNNERSSINDQSNSKDREQKRPQPANKDDRSTINSTSTTGKAFVKLTRTGQLS